MVQKILQRRYEIGDVVYHSTYLKKFLAIAQEAHNQKTKSYIQNLLDKKNVMRVDRDAYLHAPQTNE